MTSPPVIPFRLHVGVTGHRELPDDPAFVEAVRGAVARVRNMLPSSPTTPVELTVVSPLAEGADRLVATLVLEEGGSVLEAALPLPIDQYLQDFETSTSTEEFKTLLGRASGVVTMPTCNTREEAYEQIGQYVLEHSDALIALWDGEPARGRGGTAEVVALARNRGVPLLWVETAFPYTVHEEPGKDIPSQSFMDLDRYNRRPVDQLQIEAGVERDGASLLAGARKAGLDEDLLRPFCAWSLPHLARADTLALQAQKTFFRMGAAIFYLAAAAVALVAIQRVFLPEYPWIDLAEVLFMLAILGILLLGRRRHIHSTWISSRFLAEHFRARLFLALIDAGAREIQPVVRIEGTSGGWLDRAIEAVWAERPRLEPGALPLDALKRFLTSAWIEDQLKYQQKTSLRHHRRHERLNRASAVIFGLTLLAALIHVTGVADPYPPVANGLVVLSLGLPGFAGALRGVGAQREYLRNGERCRHMASQLDLLRARMLAAADLGGARRIARETEALMLSENRDWFTIMQFHDFELHV